MSPFQRLYGALQHFSVQHHLHLDLVDDLQVSNLSDSRVCALERSELASPQRLEAALAVVSDRARSGREYLCLHLLAVERWNGELELVQISGAYELV